HRDRCKQLHGHRDRHGNSESKCNAECFNFRFSKPGMCRNKRYVYSDTNKWWSKSELPVEEEWSERRDKQPDVRIHTDERRCDSMSHDQQCVMCKPADGYQ